MFISDIGSYWYQELLEGKSSTRGDRSTRGIDSHTGGMAAAHPWNIL